METPRILRNTGETIPVAANDNLVSREKIVLRWTQVFGAYPKDFPERMSPDPFDEHWHHEVDQMSDAELYAYLGGSPHELWSKEQISQTTTVLNELARRFKIQR